MGIQKLKKYYDVVVTNEELERIFGNVDEDWYYRIGEKVDKYDDVVTGYLFAKKEYDDDLNEYNELLIMNGDFAATVAGGRLFEVSFREIMGRLRK